MTETKRRKTQNIPEAQRSTERLIARIDPEIRASIAETAEAWGSTISSVVEEGHRALLEREARRVTPRSLGDRRRT